MTLNDPRLTRATLRLDDTLNLLEQAIVARNAIEKRLALSWKQIAPVMQALDRHWERAGHAKFRKLQAKHTRLQNSLSQALITCSQAREEFHESRDAYEVVQTARSNRLINAQGQIDRMYRVQGALCRTLDHALERLKSNTGPDGDQHRYDVRDGAYDYIPLDVPGFLSLLVQLDRLLADDGDYAADGQRYRPVSFLEVGCGPGRNLLLAQESGLVSCRDFVGFDINPVQVALGKRAFGLDHELQVADAMTFDFGAYDVVFSFRPFSDNQMQSALEAHIARSMRPNAYLLAPLSQDLSQYRELTPAPGASDIWKKTG